MIILTVISLLIHYNLKGIGLVIYYIFMTMQANAEEQGFTIEDYDYYDGSSVALIIYWMITLRVRRIISEC
jgi:hypothetical protein